MPRLSLTVAALVAALLQAPSAAAAPIPPITIPAGDGFILSGGQAGGCDDVTYGYEVGAAANQIVDSKPAAGCPTSTLAGRVVPAQSSAQSLRIWLADTTCVSTLASAPTYYSDGTSSGTSPSVDHALVSNSGPYIVTLDDAGGACPGTVQNANAVPSGPGQGNFHVTVTVTTPPTVSVTQPAPSHGLNGYFNAQDLAADGGAVTLNVSAKDNSTTGVRSIGCTDNGSPIPVVNLSGTSTMTGTVSVSTPGTHNVACTAADNNNENGSTGSANTATVAIDTTSPVISLPSDPLSIQGSSTGATVFSYGASASDPDSGDTPILACQPTAPHNFPVGNTTVTCIATDHAGNTTTRAFTVTVGPPSEPLAVSIRASTSGSKAKLTISCTGGGAGATCAGPISLTAHATSEGKTIIAVAASKKATEAPSGSKKTKPKPKSTVTKVVTVAGLSYSVPSGQSTTISLSLNRVGRALLSKFYKLPVTVSLGGGATSTARISFVYPMISAIVNYTASWKSNGHGVDTISDITVSHIPKGAAVGFACQRGSCSPRSDTFAVKNRSTLSLGNTRITLKRNATVAFEVTHAGQVGHVLEVTDDGTGPTQHSILCLPPGARRPAKCA